MLLGLQNRSREDGMALEHSSDALKAARQTSRMVNFGLKQSTYRDSWGTFRFEGNG